MKIVIVGGGAIGRLFGSFLAKENNEVTLIDIDHEVVGAMREQGIGVMAHGGDDPDAVTLVPVKAVSDGSSVKECDLILLMVKSFSTRMAVESIAHLVSENCPLLMVQTGLGNIEAVSRIIPAEHILVGMTFMSGTSLGGATVRHGGAGVTYIGEIDGRLTSRLETISGVFNACGIETRVSRRVIGRLWCKVIVYAAINPLSSLLKVPNGCLTTRMESITLMKRLLDEGRKVAEACGIDLVCPDLYEQLFEACERSTNNLSSMLQDILNERPTEIEAQNGAICRYAEEHGVAVPTHQTIVELIKLLEKWRPGLEQL
jgi:2-dehydropantoate 2-reductase